MRSILEKANEESFFKGHNWIALLGFFASASSLLFAFAEVLLSGHALSHWFSDFGEFTFYVALVAIPIGGLLSWKYRYAARYLGVTLLSLIIQLAAFSIILDKALSG